MENLQQKIGITLLLYLIKEYNTTYAYDPLTTDKNGWVSLDIVWNQKSNDPDDLLGGYALYSLY